MLQDGGGPKMVRRVDQGTVYRVLRIEPGMTLTLYIYQAVCYDQLDIGALACMDLISRRLQQNAEAYAHGGDAFNWASAKHISGSSTSLNLVPPEMRSYASRLSREQAELENRRTRAKTYAAGSSPGVDAAAAAVLVGRLPGGAVGHCDEGKGTGNKGGRGRGPRPSQ